MEIEIQTYLRNGGNLTDLNDIYGIKTSRSASYPSLVSFKYQITQSRWDVPFVHQCRGIILDENDNWRIVARPFDKFFNHGESRAANINWNAAKVQEKVDGSLMILYYHGEEWQVGSSGTPDANGDINSRNLTFAELFWSTWKEMGLAVPANQHTDWTLLFELTSPENRIVVRHKDRKLTLIGCRNRITGEELPVSTVNTSFGTNYPLVQSFDLYDINKVLESFDTIDPLLQEGYVVVDNNFHRIKVKHPGYVALHHTIDGFGPKTMVELIRSGETDEFLTYYPELTVHFVPVRNAYQKLIENIETAYEPIKNIPDQKSFALEAIKTRFPGALFALRSGKTSSVKKFLKEQKIKVILDLLNGE